VLVDGQEYPTVEHAYQASKTRVPIERRLIRAAISPGDAKRLGKQITLRDDWENVRLDVMRDLLRAKFHPLGLRTLLLSTGERLLIEGNNWNDTFWGVCKGQGENNLGKLLMLTRDKYRNGDYT